MSMSTIDLIQEAFNSHNIKYRLVETEQISFIDAGYNIQGGPTVRFHFISQDRDDSNDVQIRIFGLLNKIGTEKRGAILEACNKINREICSSYDCHCHHVPCISILLYG